MGQECRRWSGAEIAAALRRHLVERMELSKVCEETGCRPSQVFRWQQVLFEAAPAVLERKGGPAEKALKAAQDRVSRLQRKLQRKHEILSELMEEHFGLKGVLADREGHGSLGAHRR